LPSAASLLGCRLVEAPRSRHQRRQAGACIRLIIAQVADDAAQKLSEEQATAAAQTAVALIAERDAYVLAAAATRSEQSRASAA
jgi:hypothetical protein